MKIRPALVLAVLALRLTDARAGLVVNGSFEATNGTTLSYISLSSGSTNIPGWTTTNAELTWDGPEIGLTPPLTAAQGSDFLDLTGTHDASPYGAVFQNLATTIGQPYQVSFELGSDKYYDSYYSGGVTFTAPEVTVSLNGVNVFFATNNFPTLSNYWQTCSFEFTASASTTALTFTGASPARVAYIGLDNVTVTAVGPTLAIALTAPDSVLVSWLNTAGYTLQTNNNLSTSNWVGYSGSITNVAGTNRVAISPAKGDLFFRLSNP
jgi:Protein of unknown function (DUF642)